MVYLALLTKCHQTFCVSQMNFYDDDNWNNHSASKETMTSLSRLVMPSLVLLMSVFRRICILTKMLPC